MAKRNNNNGDDGLGLIFLGSLIGGVITSPSNEDKQKIQYFNDNQAEFHHFQLKRREFQEFLNQRVSFDNFKKENNAKYQRILALGNIALDSDIKYYKNANQIFTEAINMYANGFFRATCIFSAVTIECILKVELGDNKRFVELIDEASKNNLILVSDKNYLHGLRIDRNDYIHSMSQTVTEEDAKLIILLTVRLLNNFLKNKK